jgi:hypothetical protein
MSKSTTLETICATVVMMVEPPGEPVTRRTRPSGPSTMVGVMAESIRLPGLDGVRLALHQPELVRHPRLGGEVVHLVVEQEPGAGHGDQVAVERVDGGGHGHRVAAAVDDRVVGGVLRLGPRADLARHRSEAGLHAVEGVARSMRIVGAALGGVLVRGHARERLRHEVRVGQVGVAVHVGAARRLGEEVDVLARRGSRASARSYPSRMLRMSAEGRAAGGGRRHGDTWWPR